MNTACVRSLLAGLLVVVMLTSVGCPSPANAQVRVRNFSVYDVVEVTIERVGAAPIGNRLDSPVPPGFESTIPITVVGEAGDVFNITLTWLRPVDATHNSTIYFINGVFLPKGGTIMMDVYNDSVDTWDASAKAVDSDLPLLESGELPGE